MAAHCRVLEMIEFELPWKQIVLFGVVGVLNTALDFLLYNLFTRPPLRLSRIRANLCSTTVAMAFSFAVNFLFVLQPDTPQVPERALKFIAVTAFSLYIIQSFVIYLASTVWLAPVRLVIHMARLWPSTRCLTDEFIGKNTVKLLATVCSLIWNFFFYKYFVYVN